MSYTNEMTCEMELANLIPHCPLVLVLDTSHSMWGQGLIDLKAALRTFNRTIRDSAFQEAEIDMETIRMGENFGIMEAFTPMEASMLSSLEIRPKGDTPLGASLRLALDELENKLTAYRSEGVNFVTPQLIVLSDGKSSDDFTLAAQEIREKVEKGSLICRAIALGKDPDESALEKFAGKEIIFPRNGLLADSFREVGRVLSQEYEEKAADIILSEEEAVLSAPSGEEGKSHYLIDGTNTLFWDEYRKGVTFAHILAITDFLEKENASFTVYFDATTPHILKRHSPEEAVKYEEKLKADPEHFRQVPAGTRADDILLMEADNRPESIILSQDRFRDYEIQYPWISDRQRVVPGMVLGDRIVFPKINLQIVKDPPEK